MKAVVRAVCALLFVLPLFFVSSPAHAQVTAVAPVTLLPQYNNRWEVYGGAQYSHFNPSPGPNIHANNLVGWNGTATVYFRPLWGLQASARGLYGSMSVPSNSYGIPPSPKMSEDLFLFGPNFRFFRGERYAAGMHALVGAAYGSFDKDFPSGVQPNVVNIYNNKLAFGGAIGCSADYNLSPRLAIRAIADYQPTWYGYAQQSEFAGSIGVVFKFGTLIK
ncbi:MAG: hypothetical protein WAM66_15240 [Acidobacteriaceae bacterium]